MAATGGACLFNETSSRVHEVIRSQGVPCNHLLAPALSVVGIGGDEYGE